MAIGRPFVPGQSGNKGGRPKGSGLLLNTLAKQLTKANADAIVLKTIEDAKAGDKDARKLLFEYLVGKPRENQGEPQEFLISGDVALAALLAAEKARE